MNVHYLWEIVMSNACSMCAVCKCSFGAAPTPLMVVPPTMTMATTGFSASIMNSKPFVNIIPFGICNSPMYPTRLVPPFIPGPCFAPIASPWICGSPTVLLPSGPLLNKISMTICSLGGVIQIIAPGTPTIMTTP